MPTQTTYTVTCDLCHGPMAAGVSYTARLALRQPVLDVAVDIAKPATERGAVKLVDQTIHAAGWQVAWNGRTQFYLCNDCRLHVLVAVRDACATALAAAPPLLRAIYLPAEEA